MRLVLLLALDALAQADNPYGAAFGHSLDRKL